MQVALINPSEREILRDAGDRMPLGLLYIAQELKSHNHCVKVYDLNHDEEEETLEEIANNNPRLIGISCLTSPMVNETKRLAKKAMDLNSGKVVIGGYHPTILPNDFKDVADYVVRGEGEYALECLVDGIKADEFLFKNGVTNIEKLRPARDLVNSGNYNMQMDGMRTATMITSRGCPNECVFCGNQRNKPRYTDYDTIDQELEQIANQGYEAVYFLDDVFTLNKDRAITIAGMAHRKALPFRCTTRANYINENLVRGLSTF